MIFSEKTIKNLTSQEYLNHRKEIKSFYLNQKEEEAKKSYKLIKDNAQKIITYKFKRSGCLEICEYSDFSWYVLHYKKERLFFKRLKDLGDYLKDNKLGIGDFKLGENNDDT